MKTSSEGGSMYQKLRGLERHRDALTRSEKMLSSLSNKQGETFLSDIEDILKDIDIIVGTEEVVEGIDDEKNEIKEIEEQIATINEQVEPKLIKSEKQKAFKQLSLFMRQRKGLLENKTKLSKKVKELIRAVHADSKLREQSMAWQKVSEFENAVSGIENKIFELAKENPVAFQAYWLLKLRDWKKSYEQFGIIETESMEEQTKQIMDDARRKLEGTNGVITLLGPTGSGKTVLAKKVAEQFSTDGNFEFVSAHPKMTAFDLIQRMGIVVEELVPEQVPQKIKEAQQKYKLENPDLPEKELTTELKTIKAVIEGRAKEKTFETKPILEAVGRAKKEGHIVVIDEFNYLPPDTLAALNDILSSKDNPPGFGVVFTGNIGKEYLKRQGLDPAFVNRVLSGTVHYELPPQEIDQALDDSILTNEQLRLADVTPERNLYQIALTQLLDQKGNLLAPEETLQNVWDFTRICSLTQQLAQGKDFRSLGLQAPIGSSAFEFKSVFLSFRNINQVMREWKLDGFRQPIEWHIYDTVIRPAEVFAPKEAAQLMYLFRDWGGLFQQKTWDNVTVDTTQWRSEGLATVRSPRSKKAKLKAYQPAEVVEAVSGYRLPEQVDSEIDVETVNADKEFEISIAEAEKTLRTLEQEYGKKEYSVIEQLCDIRIKEGIGV